MNYFDLMGIISLSIFVVATILVGLAVFWNWLKGKL